VLEAFQWKKATADFVLLEAACAFYDAHRDIFLLNLRPQNSGGLLPHAFALVKIK
jgi:hypothetical protein